MCVWCAHNVPSTFAILIFLSFFCFLLWCFSRQCERSQAKSFRFLTYQKMMKFCGFLDFSENDEILLVFWFFEKPDLFRPRFRQNCTFGKNGRHNQTNRSQLCSFSSITRFAQTATLFMKKSFQKLYHVCLEIWIFQNNS